MPWLGWALVRRVRFLACGSAITALLSFVAHSTAARRSGDTKPVRVTSASAAATSTKRAAPSPAVTWPSGQDTEAACATVKQVVVRQARSLGNFWCGYALHKRSGV